MIALLCAAWAAPGDLSVGGFVGGHLAGAKHELYQAPDRLHGPLGPALPLGARAGVGLVGPLHLEVEGFVGPAAQVGGGWLYGWRGQLAALQRVGDTPFTPGFTVGFGNLGLASEALGDDLDVAGHFGPAVEVGRGKLALRADLRWILSARQGVASAPGSHGQLLVGLTYRHPRAIDSDGDGIPDAEDACPRDAEIPNGWQDQDGCPDVLATLTVKLSHAEGGLLRDTPVSDGDTVLGTTNREGRLTVRELMPGRVLTLTADTPDHEPAQLEIALVEGENEAALELGWAPGTVVITAKSMGGTPIPANVWASGAGQERWTLDSSGTGTRVLGPGRWNLMVAADGYDAQMASVDLPEVIGPRSRVEVLLRPQRVRIENGQLLTLDPVEFAVDSTELAPEIAGLLDAIAAALLNHPEVTRLEILAWAGTSAPAKVSLDRAQRRAEVVRDALTAHGVEAERLAVVVHPPEATPGGPTPDGRIGLVARPASGGPR